MNNPLDNVGGSERLTHKWEPVLEGINDNYTRKFTAALLENQAKAILNDRQKMISESAVGAGTTTVGMLGTFQKFAMPIVRRVYPNLIFNQLGATQPMQGPVSQVFYLGHNRIAHGLNGVADIQSIYSKMNLTYKGLVANRIGSASGANDGTFFSTEGESGGLGATGTGAFANFDVSNVIRAADGSPSSTMGGQIASFPDGNTTLGWAVSSGERLTSTGIPEISLQIQTQPVTARTRKMRALWTLEASQDLKAYHNLDLEQELTSLLSNELQLEIDRELIEDMRMIAYGAIDRENLAASFGWYPGSLDPQYNPNNFTKFPGKEPFVNGEAGKADFPAGSFEYDINSGATSEEANTPGSNVFVVDLSYYSDGTSNFAPQHIGHVYANLLATINLASQDIYRTTFRGPGSWMITSPLMAAMLESAAKLEGGINSADRPSNIGNTSIEFKGKFAGRYDLFVDPMFPTDEILMGYKGAGPMDSGFIYCPYIPLQQLPTITDPESFQPRKGLLTRYGKVAIQPASRFFRVIRVVGASANYLIRPNGRNNKLFGEPTGRMAY